MIFVKKLNVVKKIDESRLEEYERAGYTPLPEQAQTEEPKSERIPCPYCDKDYATKETLAAHIKEKHPEQAQTEE